MKKQTALFISAVFLFTACSSDEENRDGITTYRFHDDKLGHALADSEEEEAIAAYTLPSPYEISIDDSFERVSRYTTGKPPEEMLFWHKASEEETAINIETSLDDLKTEVPTIELVPTNKVLIAYLRNPDFFLEEQSDEEMEDMIEELIETVNNPPEGHLDDFIDEQLTWVEQDTTMTNVAEDYKLFTRMIEFEEEAFEQYQFIGETDNVYLTATITIPNGQKDEFLPTIEDALNSITYNEDEFSDEPNYDLKDSLSYKPGDYGDSYPDIGYSFVNPEETQFHYSFPSFYPYRFHFLYEYSNQDESDYLQQSVSELVIRLEHEENANNRETDMRAKQPEDYVPYDVDEVTNVEHLHDDPDADFGIFTTAIRVEFGWGYEEYWFLHETDGHVVEIEFDFFPDAPEADELLEHYMRVVRTVELDEIE